MRTGGLFFAVLSAIVCSGQSSEQLLVEMRRAYQDEPIVYLHRNTTIRIERTPQGLIASRQVDEEELVLKELSGAARENQVHYSFFQQLEDLDAYTMAPQGKGYKRIRVDHVAHRDARDRQTFHDDQRVASFLFPQMVSGAIGHLSYTLQCSDARFVGGHFFEDVHPSEVSTLTVISDPGVSVDLRTFQMAEGSYERTVTTEHGRTVQRLSMQKVPAIKFESNAPSARFYTPHVQLLVKRADGPADEWTPAELYGWFSGLVAPAILPSPGSITQLADSITAGITGPRAKAAAIYDWVQLHIRYVAFEDGMNGFIPARPEDVYRVRYGDCKGMSNLLRALLDQAGLNAHLAWIGTRALPYELEEFPSSSATDHMIVALDLPDTTLFLDATSHDIGLGVPSGFIQGKQALIGIDSTTWRIQRVPEMPAEFSLIIDSVEAQIDGADIIGKGVMRARGYERYQLLDWWRSTSPDDRSELMRYVLMKSSNAFLLDTFEVEGTDRTDAEFAVRYAFRIPGAIVRSGQRMFVPSILTDPWSDLRSSKDRKLPLELEHRTVHRSVVQLKAPGNAVCTVSPSPIDDHGKGFSMRSTTRCSGDGIFSETTFTLDALLIDEEMNAWQESNKRIVKAMSSNAVLELR